ncbi:hypothetical protein HW532_20810 [Kaustia mangrovi]|uniref:Uncharacterized protein n=1 Tax=Kaustia mangrovi TaxID=2593653 RepID=A0A7S8C7X1_9HYPH|nr:hypothetical protein [Kaustia mangrovi]QPC44921.1 hypothetical protein HW532_20810 [Kaustia mangrovi]
MNTGNTIHLTKTETVWRAGLDVETMDTLKARWIAFGPIDAIKYLRRVIPGASLGSYKDAIQHLAAHNDWKSFVPHAATKYWATRNELARRRDRAERDESCTLGDILRKATEGS